MDQFAQQLRAVTEDPPPTGIDLDRLITGEYRRRRRVQYGFAGGAVAASVALVLAVPTVFSGGGVNAPPGGPPLGAGCRTADAPGPQQSHSSPRPTEPCADAIVRLQNALFDAIEGQAPGLVKPDSVTFTYVPKRLRYESVVNMPDARGGGLVRVEIVASHEYANVPRVTCRPEVPCDPDAPKIRVETQGPGGPPLQAFAHFKDGTMLMVYSTAKVLTSMQIGQIAGDEALTLFPESARAAAKATNRPAPGAHDANTARLTAQLRPALERMLPAVALSGPGNTSAAWFVPSPGFGYDAVLEISDASGRGGLFVNYLLERPPCTTQPLCETDPECPHASDDTSCTVEPDGTKVAVVKMSTEDVVMYGVGIYRPDGTIVQLHAGNYVADQSQPVSPSTKPTAEFTKGSRGIPGYVVDRDRPFLTTAQLVELGKQLHH